ncbi:MAG: OB-fold nucleic acid binding domain-containing protein [Actinomycetota bacterium]|nr:OB-fold nucleic acid binding domain-containing protein [Actinomycetota bacterium]
MTTTQESGNWLTRRLRRLTADPNELDAEDLLCGVRRTAGCEPVANCSRGKVVTVTGRVKSVVYLPQGSVPTLEAELYDGSGSVVLVWLGRRQISGIEPGRSLTARGRIAENQGRRVIYNPWYELSPA